MEQDAEALLADTASTAADAPMAREIGAAAQDAAQPTAVDVVIPIYNAAADLERCVESILAHTATLYRLLLIDDASTDPAVAAYLAALAERRLTHVAVLRNEANMGFTATANRGMNASTTADVVLLNSDTIVTGGWLDALCRCARSDASIGTIKPFSNN